MYRLTFSDGTVFDSNGVSEFPTLGALLSSVTRTLGSTKHDTIDTPFSTCLWCNFFQERFVIEQQVQCTEMKWVPVS